MREHRKEGTALTKGGLITLVIGTMLLMAWALFPTAAVANEQVSTPWTGNGSQHLPCNGTTLWILSGFGNQASEVVGNPQLVIQGVGTFTMSPNGNTWRVEVSGNVGASPSASALWVWDESDNTRPTPNLVISHCEGTVTTTSTSPPSTSTTPPTTTETTPPTTTETTPPSTSTTPPSTSTTPPDTSTTPPSSSTSVAPTTITPPEDSTTPPGGTTVSPTTVSPPGGTAFTGLENVIPLGAIALTLMTAGSGLMWAGSRRNRKDEE